MTWLNHSPSMVLSPNTRAKCGSSDFKSRRVSLTSNTKIRGMFGPRTTSAAEYVARAARIGGAVQHSPDHLDDGGRRGVTPIRPWLHQMAEIGQLLDRRARDAPFDTHLARRELVIAEGVVEVARLEAGSLHGLLGRHAELQDVQQNLNQRLVLVIAAWCRHGEHQLAVARHDGGTQRHARTLAGSYLIRMPGRQDKRFHAYRERNTGIVDDDGRNPGSAGRSG